MTSVLGLPAISPEIKSISPWLQRADELQVKEPVMAYWCAYFAAQTGISLKVKSPPARDLLFALLGVLEKMKQELGPSDAVNVEAVSSAYVENFALKVFAAADNEDRAGKATRSTAKKFLAAANFLEVLKIFPQTPISESSVEKIKYSKWKAADIAKAFREGRKPASGPAGSELDLEFELPEQPIAASSSSPPKASSSSPPLPPPQTLPTKQSSPPTLARKISPKRTSPPPVMNADDIARANIAPREFQSLARKDGYTEEVSNPGTWSTAATPGSDAGEHLRRVTGEVPDSDARSNTKKPARGTSRLRSAWVSGEIEDKPEGEDEQDGPDDGSPKRTVRFTPSVTGGLTPPVTSASYTAAPLDVQGSSTSPTTTPSTVTPRDILSTSHKRQTSSSSIPTSSSPPKRTRAGSTSPSNAHGSTPTPITKPSAGRQLSNTTTTSEPLSTGTGIGGGSAASSSSSPPRSAYLSSSPPLASTILAQPSAPPLSYATADNGGYSPPSTPPELTPQVIAKAQKHCRFAISALDYEDAEQARKELRAALAVLGG
ncbi:hypothetical protein HWV62_20158 [Athelia sp. TMB]|nr:hypothetical protein HWV62_20158 [Athelia sp. TMB]